MSRYGRYEDALITQQRLLEWSTSRTGIRYLRGFYEDLNAKHNREAQRDPRMLVGLQLATLQQAEPIYVSEDACQLIDHARETWRPEKVIGSDAFVPDGFALFPRPIMLDDMPPTAENPGRSSFGLVPVRAMSWLSIISEDASVGTFWISFYTAIDDEFDTAEELGVRTRWEMPPPGEEPLDRDFLRRTMPLSLVHQWQWSWGTDGDHEYGDWDDPHRYDVLPEDSPEQMIERARQQCAFVQTFWRIASQFIPAKHRVPRQMWRDARRHGIEARDVTVIVLRRERERPDYDPDPTGREYHVSFIVHGYWAIRHTRNGPRQTWVRPHVKGQGPFQETTRAWEFRR